MVNYYWDRYIANPIYNYQVTWDAFDDGSYSEAKIPDLNNPSTKYYFNASADNNGNVVLSNEVYGAHLTTVGGVIFRKYENQPQLPVSALKVLVKNDGSVRVTARNVRVIQNLTGYAKGAHVQSNVVADYNAYTPNARNADGYWYERKGIVNTAPVWNAIPTQTVRKNTIATVILNNYASDIDGNALTFTASSNNTAVATVSISGGNLTVHGIAIGTATITVTANDGNGGVTSTTFTVTVANTGPVSTTIPSQTTKKSSTVTINLANYFSDADNDALTFTASSANTNIATVSVSGNLLTISGVSIGASLITVTASDSRATALQSFTATVTNSVPTVAVTAPSANMTLYENDTFNVAGSASDVDTNQSVTVYAQVNNEQRIVLNVGLSNVPIPFNKQLKFVGGQLYDGDTPITNSLTDGVPHTLKIWAQDGDGGQSAITERAFYVVPNRPPILTVDTVQPNGIINTDKFTISGEASDPDGNPVTAAYRINGGNSVNLQITDGKWAFDIALAQLQVGQNTIVVELTDSYNFKVSKTIKFNKNEVKTPILQSVARYKIEPPKGSAKGVLLWIQRDANLANLKVELSMTLQGEQENYVTLTATNTAPVDNLTVEDEFYFETVEVKNNIILKLSTSRADINNDQKIHLISGVLE